MAETRAVTAEPTGGRLGLVDDLAQGRAQKPPLAFFLGNWPAQAPQLRRHDLGGQTLAVDQHAVAVEDDKLDRAVALRQQLLRRHHAGRPSWLG